MDDWNPMQEDYESERNNYKVDIDDACVAVSGYKPTDDERICKLYNKYGRCTRKSCKFEHVKVDSGTFTTDRREVYQNAYNKFNLPTNGSNVTVFVTAVISPTMFFAQIKSNQELNYDYDDEEPETLSTLMTYLNDPKNNSFEPLGCPPTIGEIVIVRESKYWLRARVDNVNDDSTCSIFFVDFGTREVTKLKDIFEMQPKFLHLPFQAIECRLANVELNDCEIVDDCYYHLSNLIKEKVLNGKVFENFQELQRLELLLEDANGHDIGLKLVESGCYKLIKKPHEISVEDNYLPG